VLYVGSSNFAGWHIATAVEQARSRHFLGLVSEQCLYNLVNRHAEEEVLPAAQHHGLGVLPWSPLQGGLLGGILRKQRDTGRSAGERQQQLLEQHGESVRRYEELCDRIGEHPARVGLAWLLRQPAVTAPIVGPRTEEQLAENIAALEVQLDDETLEQLDGIFPGPGPAPEAWAW